MGTIPYFAYGTTQKGFAHHRRLADLLGEPVARVRTVSAHAIVVPERAACNNPGCSYVHRMAVLVAGVEPLRAEGDLFLLTQDAIAELDRLELAGPYVRAPVAVVSPDGADTYTAQAYFARDQRRWHVLTELGRAEVLSAYPRRLATNERHKDCCIRTPGHTPPHDVIDPLEDV